MSCSRPPAPPWVQVDRGLPGKFQSHYGDVTCAMSREGACKVTPQTCISRYKKGVQKDSRSFLRLRAAEIPGAAQVHLPPPHIEEDSHPLGKG